MLIAACPNPECGASAEIVPWAVADSTNGPVPHVRTLCVNKHCYLLPDTWVPSRDTSPGTARAPENGVRDMPASDTLLVECDEGAAPPLVALLEGHGAPAQFSAQRNLDGSAAVSWLVVAAIAVKTVPDVLRALTEFLNRQRVRRVEFRGLVIDNPRPEDVDAIIGTLTRAGDSQSAS
jgi:hypothetical protein